MREKRERGKRKEKGEKVEKKGGDNKYIFIQQLVLPLRKKGEEEKEDASIK